MDHHFPQEKDGKTRVLVAPLDWGLGHATRCIPVIRELLAQGAEPWLAGEGAQELVLREAFPQLPFLALPGYRVQYAKTAGGLIRKIIGQVPKINRAIRREHEWLKEQAGRHRINAVISDNRYGLYHEGIPCIIITHQLRIKSPLGVWSERILQKNNYRYLNRFTECWIPDQATGNILAGELSHPRHLPGVPLRYIGPLTRFEKKEIPVRKNHLLFLLSGPEPQRTLLENRVIQEIGTYHGTATVVRGLPGNRTLIPSTGMLQFYNHLPAAALNDRLLEADLVIARSGYSTLMDALSLQKKMMLIPTPGQTEQEYLARYLQQHNIAPFLAQKDFTLQAALNQAAVFPYVIPDLTSTGAVKDAVAGLLAHSAAPARG